MNSFVEENYLKALYTLANSRGDVTGYDLAKHLAVKMPTVTNMMKKLATKKLVYYERYKPIRLTERGKKDAIHIIRKHRLTEMFLVEKMGFGWEQVHDIAEQIEHIHAPEFFTKMDELLGFPAIDPHGSPIPNKKGKIAGNTYKKLSDCSAGDTVILSAVTNSSVSFLKFLNRRSLHLGLVVKIKSVESFDKSMHVRYSKHPSEVLSHLVCEHLLVKNNSE